MFFFEKKNQKTFAIKGMEFRLGGTACWGERWIASHGLAMTRVVQGEIAKVFCFFFSKKKYFLPC